MARKKKEPNRVDKLLMENWDLSHLLGGFALTA